MELTFCPARLAGETAAPASKSEAHRRMICAGLTAGETVLTGFMPSEDMTATMNCLSALGVGLREERGTLTVAGGARPPLMPLMDCGESGSTLRFFVPVALALTGGGVFRMHGRLSQRPMDVYQDLFVPRGVRWHMREGADDAAELSVVAAGAQMQAGSYVLPGSVSSQFVSGLLFTLPLLPGESELTVTPPVESAAYIRMTVQTLLDSGIELEETEPFHWRIPGMQRYAAKSGALEGDWSQAAAWLCAGALGADIRVRALRADTLQGDRAILRHLQALGAAVEENEDFVRVAGGRLHGAELDMRDTPDIAPMVALVCQLAEGESRLNGCGRLRLKESDRLRATVRMLNDLGGHAREDGDAIVIRGVGGLRGNVTVEDEHDHRMVVLASLAALRADGPVTVRDAEALNKSWPGYPEAYRALGGVIG